jgi:hypothetical protein
MNLVSSLRRVGFALAATLTLAGPAMAQAYDGDWAGTLEAGGQKLRLELHLKTVSGEATAVLDSLDQGSTIPATAVKTDGGELSILFLAIGGELKGKLSPDGKTITGSFTQGATLPLILTKK